MTGPASALFLPLGLGGGVACFALLRWNVRLYLQGGRIGAAILLHLGRLAGTGALLVAAAWCGPLPLLLTAAGMMLARLLVARPAREEAG